MTTDTLLAISAGATFLLALAAFWAIWQNHSLRKKERKERLLSEIIEWATDLANVAFGHEITSIPREKEIRKHFALLGNKVFRYQAIDTRSPYIAKCAQVFGKKLHTAVSRVISCRKDVGVKIDKCVNNFEDEDSKKALITSEHELRKRALGLIELVAKIKIQDIGK